MEASDDVSGEGESSGEERRAFLALASTASVTESARSREEENFFSSLLLGAGRFRDGVFFCLVFLWFVFALAFRLRCCC